MDENEDITKWTDDELRAERIKTYAGSPKDLRLSLQYRPFLDLENGFVIFMKYAISAVINGASQPFL